MAPTTMEPNQPQIEALKAAADVLEIEVNQLSRFAEKPLTPHRVSIAVAYEKRRLTIIASTLRSMLPRKEVEEE